MSILEVKILSNLVIEKFVYLKIEMSAQRMRVSQEIFGRLENNMRRALRRISDAMRNLNVRHLLSFFTIGKILNIVLHVIDRYKVPICCRNCL